MGELLTISKTSNWRAKDASLQQVCCHVGDDPLTLEVAVDDGECERSNIFGSPIHKSRDRDALFAQTVARVVIEEQTKLHKAWEEKQEEAQRKLVEKLLLGLTERFHGMLEAELSKFATAGAGWSPPRRRSLSRTAVAVQEGEDEGAAAAAASPGPSADGQPCAERVPSLLCGGGAPAIPEAVGWSPPRRRSLSRTCVTLPDGAVPRAAADRRPAQRQTPVGKSEGSSPCRGADVEEILRTPSVATGNADSEVPAIQRQNTEMTLKSEVRSQENEKWKHQWRQNLKARLSRRLNSGNVSSDSPRQSKSAILNISRKWARDPPWEETAKMKASQAEVFVDSHVFQAVCSFVIVVNAAFIGVETNITTQNAAEDPKKQNPGWFRDVNTLFVALFLAEVLIRIMVKRARFFVGREWRWNLFDFATLAMTCVEEYGRIGSMEWDFTYTRIVRGFRMIRILRIIRVLRFFRELRLMVCSITSSIVSLSWALVLLFIIIYLFTICFMHAVDRYLRDEGGGTPEIRQELVTWYGSVPTAMYSLLMAISGGVDWHEMVAPLAQISHIYTALFVFYVLFIIIGVLNVLTSVFVQRANDLVKLDRDLVIQNQLVSNETFQREMKSIFEEVDVDGTGKITWEKFWEYLQNEEVQAYFVTQQLDTSDARELFNLLDAESKEEVKIEDFIMGCMKLRGQARSSDVATLIRESKKAGIKTMRAMRKMDRQLSSICHHLAPEEASQTSWWNAFSPGSRWGGSPTPASRYLRDVSPTRKSPTRKHY